MSMNAAVSQLNDARKVMLTRWEIVHRQWRDPAAQRFQETFIETIDRDLQKTLTGLNQMGSVIQQARQDCA